MQITITLDLNDLQYESIRQIAERYPHGWHTADLVIRRDAVEKRYEADWVKDVARAVASELAQRAGSARERSPHGAGGPPV